MPEDFLGETVGKQFGILHGLLKGGVIEQDAITVLLQFNQGKRNTVELAGGHNGIAFLTCHKGNGTEDIHLAQRFVVDSLIWLLNADVFLTECTEAFLMGHGLSKVIPLNLFAADIPEITELFLCFDALSQRMNVNAFGHFNDGSGNPLGTLIEGAQKTHVQFQFIKGIFLENVERGIGASEIIHPDLIAGCPETGDDFDEKFFLLSHDAFRDLTVNKIMWNLILADDLVKFRKNVTKGKIKTGQIDRNRYGCFAAYQGMTYP